MYFSDNFVLNIDNVFHYNPVIIVSRAENALAVACGCGASPIDGSVCIRLVIIMKRNASNIAI